MIRCNTCGADNRDGARHCKICGAALAMPAPRSTRPSALPASAGSSPPPPIPQRQPMSHPQHAASLQTAQHPQPMATRLRSAVVASTNLRGLVIDDPNERRDFPPRDWGKALVIMAVLILVLPLLISFLAASMLILILLVVLGVGLSCLLIPLGLMTTLAAVFRGRQRAEVPFYEFRVQGQLGSVVNVEMIGRRSGGRIARGDDVEAEGEWGDASYATLRAWRVTVHQVAGVSGQHGAGGVVTADRPWSRRAGMLAVIASLALAVILYGLPILGALSSSGRWP